MKEKNLVTTIEYKLELLSDIWSNYIFKYKCFSFKLKFDESVKTNYVTDIFGYFQDTMDIIFPKKNINNNSNRFSYNISFLQAIYIQQDFIEEILRIFKTEIDKGKLKKDQNYWINRDIRNEFIGHPVRILKGQLVSTTVFSYKSNEDEIQYILYHADNNYQLEVKTYQIKDIQERHKKFLEKYLDETINRLKKNLCEYLSELKKIEKVIENGNFKTILKLVEIYFESIFSYAHCYNKECLLKIFEKKNEHERYKNHIDKFNLNLYNYISDTKKNIEGILNNKKNEAETTKKANSPEIKVIFVNYPEEKKFNPPQKETYSYEIAKLSTKRNRLDFEFFCELLRGKCKDNELVLRELNHMEQNIDNEIEYYTALGLIIQTLIK
jgi:hypothetical protein